MVLDQVIRHAVQPVKIAACEAILDLDVSIVDPA
jgi:hypothetical protein